MHDKQDRQFFAGRDRRMIRLIQHKRTHFAIKTFENQPDIFRQFKPRNRARNWRLKFVFIGKEAGVYRFAPVRREADRASRFNCLGGRSPVINNRASYRTPECGYERSRSPSPTVHRQRHSMLSIHTSERFPYRRALPAPNRNVYRAGRAYRISISRCDNSAQAACSAMAAARAFTRPSKGREYSLELCSRRNTFFRNAASRRGKVLSPARNFWR